MAALHSALQVLAPIDFSSVPLEGLPAFLKDNFKKSQTIIDSVPLPLPSDNNPTPTGRSRSNTATSIASSASEISASSARPLPPVPEHAILQKEWGKPIKLSAKDNPLNMSVYKLPARDSRGSWFARRSVHEGLGFRQWKKSLEKEFPETMMVQGGPGEGNIRGIGGERRVEKQSVDGVGKMEVYHLSAQFPGPTTPRDFVTLLMTSSTALPASTYGNGSTSITPVQSTVSAPEPSNTHRLTEVEELPRHFMVVSKPCIHPDCPPRDGFIRGEYESVEFIREIPIKPVNRASHSTTDLHHMGEVKTSGRNRASSNAVGREAILRNAERRTNSFPVHNNSKASQSDTELHKDPTSHAQLEVPGQGASKGRARGKTISFAESRGLSAKGEDLDNRQVYGDDEEGETNPVEWIMITRSDPGGSVPRWMVERGTPSSIVADASKFLDWACQKEHLDSDSEDELESPVHEPNKAHHQHRLKQPDALHANGHLAGLDGSKHEKGSVAPSDTLLRPLPARAQTRNTPTHKKELSQDSSLFSSMTSAVGAGIAAYTPTYISSHLPVFHTEQPHDESPSDLSRTASVDSTASTNSMASAHSFATAASNATDRSTSRVSTETLSIPTPVPIIGGATTPTPPPTTTPAEKELAKFQERKTKLIAKLQKQRASYAAEKLADASSKEAKEMAKAEEKHEREMHKVEERYSRELSKIDARREKEAKKNVERERKREERDERTKLIREREESRKETEALRRERDALRVVVGELQRENTGLVARLGREGLGPLEVAQVMEKVKIGEAV